MFPNQAYYLGLLVTTALYIITINKSNYVTNHDKINNKHKTIKYQKLADVDINTLGPCILDTLNFMDNSKDTNENNLTSSWTSRVLSILDTHWSVRTKRNKKEHQPGWLTADIRKLMKERVTFKVFCKIQGITK